jgi:glucan phosphoethanolaminetransferase (alkaline phosphatase superfamily)
MSSTSEQAAPTGSSQSSEVAGASTEKKDVSSSTSPVAPATPAETVSYTQPQSEQNQTTLMKIGTRMSVSASWIILLIAIFILLLIVAAIFIHIEIQPTDMLLGGAFVVVVALVFMALNVTTINSALYGSQSASVYQGSLPSMLLGSGWSVGE